MTMKWKEIYRFIIIFIHAKSNFAFNKHDNMVVAVGTVIGWILIIIFSL